MTWYEEVDKLDPLEAAKKYILLLNSKDYNGEDEKLLRELDILWLAGLKSEEGKRILLGK